MTFFTLWSVGCLLATHFIHWAGRAFTVFSFITPLCSGLFPLQTMKSPTKVLILSWLSCRQLFPSMAVAVVPLKPILQSASNPTLSPCPHELATSSPLLPTEASAHWPPDLWFTPSLFTLGHNIPATIFPPQYTQHKKKLSGKIPKSASFTPLQISAWVSGVPKRLLPSGEAEGWDWGQPSMEGPSWAARRDRGGGDRLTLFCDKQ